MSYMHLSTPSTPTRMDLNFKLSPRDKLMALLQKEQDEVMSLLDANPFVTSLLTKYADGGGAKSPSTENEELVALRAANNAIREDYERLHANYETVKQQKKAADMMSEGFEMKRAGLVEEKNKLAEENEALKASLEASESEITAGLEQMFEMKENHASSLEELKRENEDNKAKAAAEVSAARAELEQMKTRCDYLWQTISEKSPQPTEPIKATAVASPAPFNVDPPPGPSGPSLSRISTPEPSFIPSLNRAATPEPSFTPSLSRIGAVTPEPSFTLNNMSARTPEMGEYRALEEKVRIEVEREVGCSSKATTKQERIKKRREAQKQLSQPIEPTPGSWFS